MKDKSKAPFRGLGDDKIVFSTNRDFNFEDEQRHEQETVSPAQQTLYISLERLKGGKIATRIENFTGKGSDLEALGKNLKNKCGSGGTVKDGVILIQGEQREKVIAILSSLGYKTKRKGG